MLWLRAIRRLVACDILALGEIFGSAQFRLTEKLGKPTNVGLMFVECFE